MKTKMTPQAHTPTPWRFKLSVDDAQKYVYAAEVLGADQRRVYLRKKYFGEGITSDQLSVDAAFIVRACNAHDALIQTIKNIQDRIYGIQSQTEESRRMVFEYAWNQCQQAIAKAEGK